MFVYFLDCFLAPPYALCMLCDGTSSIGTRDRASRSEADDELQETLAYCSPLGPARGASYRNLELSRPELFSYDSRESAASLYNIDDRGSGARAELAIHSNLLLSLPYTISQKLSYVG